MDYLILLNPGHSRVYFEESKALSIAEFSIAATRFDTPCLSAGQETVCGIEYLRFTAADRLSARDLALVSRLSFVYALFERRGDGALFPVQKSEYRYCDDSISSILKYTGKTNELFTRMMINLAILSSDFTDERDIALLDPIAGKGTTLFEGLACGYNVSGIEIGTKAVSEMAAYFRKFLETKKFKFSQKSEKVSGPNKSFTAQRYHYELARSKQDLEVKTLTMIAGNSIYADKFFSKNSFHILVGDLPYGVQHGSVTNEKQDTFTRNAIELLKTCLPAWHGVLKPRGALVLAYNKLTTKQPDLEKALRDVGFHVLDTEPYRLFEHRVDNSIRRDIVVAIK